jgi:LAO/AO transport system kinase
MMYDKRYMVSQTPDTSLSHSKRLAKSVLAGERLALARLLSQIEDDSPIGKQALGELFPSTGEAYLIGITGAPGTGKSTLVNRLAHYYRHPPGGEQPYQVAIVAVDPSSPFSGGAILGDRVRMRDLAGDPGVFIRSMASRGSLGGLAHATGRVVQVFDAAGFEIILIETMGAGQAEVDVASLAHTTIVVEAPGFGDDIQAVKAGILEIADILVINKADRPGVENTERALNMMLQLAHPTERVFRHHDRDELVPELIPPNGDEVFWTPPVLKTIATEGQGIPDLVAAIADHRAHLQETGTKELRDRTRLQTELDSLLQDKLVARWRTTVSKSKYQQVLDLVVQRELSPHQAVDVLLDGSQLHDIQRADSLATDEEE